MAQNFTRLSFTDSVKEAQTHYGSREIYRKIESREDHPELTSREKDFIECQDHFYMATVGENGWPYVQFRGGQKGFLKIIDNTTLGYADYRGNLQYISVGNINSSNKAALILLDYARRMRLKLWAEAEISDASPEHELFEKLVDQDYKSTVERLVVFKIQAFDWNCPQHITQRFTEEEFNEIDQSDTSTMKDCIPK